VAGSKPQDDRKKQQAPHWWEFGQQNPIAVQYSIDAGRHLMNFAPLSNIPLRETQFGTLIQISRGFGSSPAVGERLIVTSASRGVAS
jgi:hypothetical protein